MVQSGDCVRGANWGDVEHVNEEGSSGFRSSRETRGIWVHTRFRSTLPQKFMNSFEYTSNEFITEFIGGWRLVMVPP
jgi:hypothetical protein